MALMTKKSRRPGRTAKGEPRQTRGDRVEGVYAQLRELILNGRMAPGSRILETDIAERFGVSRTPVRSALQRLRQEGFIVSADHTSQARLWVAPLSRADARELLAIVGQCEGLAAGWAAELPGDEREAVVRRLRELNGRFHERGATQKPDPDELFGIDRELHLTFFDAGAGPRLKSLHESVKPQVERYLALYMKALVDRLEDSVHDHEAVIAAIERGDPEAARSIVAANWAAAAQRLDGVMERLGERGIW
jgi:DNA-binding GntR family transcriptional regulator